MSARLPYRLDPFRAADRGSELSGEIPLARMRRLASLLTQTDSSACCELRFSRIDSTRFRLEGSVQARLSMVCQRCLEPVTRLVKSAFRLALVRSEAEAARVEEGWDPLLLEAEMLDIVRVIEDELLLTMPDIPRHADDEACGLTQWRIRPSGRASLEDLPDEEGTENPFAVLADLKKH